MNCQNCGGQIPEGTAFCPTCGAQVQQAPTQPVQPQGGQQYNGQPQGGAADTSTEKVIAIVSYFGFLGLIFHFAKVAKTPFGQFHAKQASNLFIISFIVSMAVSIVKTALYAAGLPTILVSMLGLVSTLVWILEIIGIVYAIQGKMEKVPLIDKIEIIK